MKPKIVMKPSNYKALEQWHNAKGSNQYYIEWLQQKAANDSAALDVIYRDNQENKWVRVRDLDAAHPFRKQWEK